MSLNHSASDLAHDKLPINGRYDNYYYYFLTNTMLLVFNFSLMKSFPKYIYDLFKLNQSLRYVVSLIGDQ